MINPAIDEIFKLIQTTLPEITISEKDTQSTRDNFLDLVRPLIEGGSAALAVPLMLVCADKTEDEPDGPIDCDCKRLPIRLFYVAGFGDGTGMGYQDADGNSYTDCAAYVGERLNLLRTALMDLGESSHNFNLRENPEIDVSQSSDPNQLFSENGWPYFAGSLEASLLITLPL